MTQSNSSSSNSGTCYCAAYIFFAKGAAVYDGDGASVRKCIAWIDSKRVTIVKCKAVHCTGACARIPQAAYRQARAIAVQGEIKSKGVLRLRNS